MIEALEKDDPRSFQACGGPAAGGCFRLHHPARLACWRAFARHLKNKHLFSKCFNYISKDITIKNQDILTYIVYTLKLSMSNPFGENKVNKLLKSALSPKTAGLFYYPPSLFRGGPFHLQESASCRHSNGNHPAAAGISGALESKYFRNARRNFFIKNGSQERVEGWFFPLSGLVFTVLYRKTPKVVRNLLFNF